MEARRVGVVMPEKYKFQDSKIIYVILFDIPFCNDVCICFIALWNEIALRLSVFMLLQTIERNLQWNTWNGKHSQAVTLLTNSAVPTDSLLQ